MNTLNSLLETISLCMIDTEDSIPSRFSTINGIMSQIFDIYDGGKCLGLIFYIDKQRKVQQCSIDTRILIINKTQQ